MLKPKGKTLILYLIIGGICIWSIESLIHSIITPENFFWSSFTDISAHEVYMRLTFIGLVFALGAVLLKNKTIQDKDAHIETIFNNVIPICITDLNYDIIRANKSYWSIWGPENIPIKCYDNRPGKSCHTEKCALTNVLNGVKEYVCESQKKHNGEEHHFIVTARPFLDRKNKIVGVIESFQDITERKNLESEKALLIDQLESSLEKVKLLSGFLPICSSCKKIRDDKGYWTQIEGYIKDHSEAEFSHGICEECVQKLYPEYMDEINIKK